MLYREQEGRGTRFGSGRTLVMQTAGGKNYTASFLSSHYFPAFSCLESKLSNPRKKPVDGTKEVYTKSKVDSFIRHYGIRLKKKLNVMLNGPV